MDPTDYLKARYHANPAASLKLRTAMDAFRAAAPDGHAWTRSRFLAAVAAEFEVGTDAAGVVQIVGLSQTAPKRLTVDDRGRLVRA